MTKKMTLKDAERELVRMRKELRAFETKERAFGKRVERMRHEARKLALVAAPGLAGWRAVRSATVKKGDLIRLSDGTERLVTHASHSEAHRDYTFYFDKGGSLSARRRDMHLVARPVKTKR